MSKKPTEEAPTKRIRQALEDADRELLDAADEETPLDEDAPEGGAIGRLEQAKRAKDSEVSNKQLEGLADWQKEAVPSDLPIPRGEEIAVFRFKAEHCKGPAKAKGDRTCVIWALSVRDERVARSRMFGDATRGLEEMAKGMIRAIDGHILDPQDPQQIERFWDEIGPRHRNFLVAWYQKSHNFSDDERYAFFVDCVAVRTAR